MSYIDKLESEIATLVWVIELLYSFKMPPPVAAAVPPKIEQPTIPPAAVPAAVDAFRKAVVYAALGKVPQKDPDFPGVCPRCGGPAYVGATSVDCKAKCSP
jgi:hypothetical protein